MVVMTIDDFDRKGKSSFPVSEDIGDGVCVCDVGHEQTVSGHEYGPAVREYYLIHVVLRGKGVFSRGGKTYELCEGDAFLIRPMEVTVYTADQTEPWEYYWIGFKGLGAKALADYSFPADQCLARADQQTVMPYLSQFSALHRGENDQLALRSTLYGLLSGLRKSIVGEQKAAVDVVDRALKYINAYYFRAISVSAIAKEMNVTRSYFTTLFTARVGDSPYNYITKLRIESAKSLIARNHELTASEVAYSVGFASLERFSEMFKKYVGVSPQAYKKSIYKL